MKKLLLSSLGLAALLSLPTAYAGDCATSFDQSCLAHRYNRRQVESDQVTREAGIIATSRAQLERARADAERDERQAHRARIERAYARIEQTYQEDRDAARKERVEREQRYEERQDAIEKQYNASTGRRLFQRSTKRSWLEK